MTVYRFPQPPSSEITPEHVWQDRRRLLTSAALLATGAATPFSAATAALAALPATPNRDFTVMEKPTPEKDVVSYNNFYEFGLEKSDPARYAGAMKVRPWTVQVEGEVAKPGIYGIEDLLGLDAMQDRVYRMRCVEGWSMVIPWVGYPLASLLKKVEPTSNGKYVEFYTAEQPAAMPGLRSSVIDWPYREGLRMDEAMHPLTLLTFGLYGKVLPNQNGAPVRMVIPWKYGFKSGKSIVKIRVTEKEPLTSWVQSAPHEYGLYANVNPNVTHPRWSQATERVIGEGNALFERRRPTLMFNGYADQVASLYAGMDLRKHY